MVVFQNFNKWFWNEYFWLPPNVTWRQIAEKRVANYAQFSELYYAFYVAIVLLFVRYFLEKFVFSPFGCYCGLKPKAIKITEQPILEQAFCINGKIGYKQVQGLAKQLDWSERKVERWIRKRTSRDRPSTLSKFTESAWRFTFYLTAFLYGFYTLSDKPWLWDTTDCWNEYPHHDLPRGIWWYYMLELGFYWSLTFSQFMDIKRKDFLQMFLHHIVTILLLTFSWTSNLFRIGSLVLLIHDFADVPLEAAKLAKYIEKQWLADGIFIIFTLAWIFSRLILYPYRIVYEAMFKATVIVPLFPAYYFFNSLLCVLQVLHIVWTWVIVKIALQAVSSKQPGVKDLRSDSENVEYSSSSDETVKTNCNSVQRDGLKNRESEDSKMNTMNCNSIGNSGIKDKHSENQVIPSGVKPRSNGNFIEKPGVKDCESENDDDKHHLSNNKGAPKMACSSSQEGNLEAPILRERKVTTPENCIPLPINNDSKPL